MSLINRVYLRKFRNEPHVQFHASVATLITILSTDVLPFAEMFNLYKLALGNEKKALLIITKSQYTEQIIKQDGARDRTFRGFANTVKGFRNHYHADTVKAANRLWSLFKHFGNVPRKTFDAETAAISDFLSEIQHPDLQVEVTTLGLEGWLNQLTLENDRFHELMMARFNETTKRTSFRMKTARLETDKYYRAIITAIENTALIRALTAHEQHFVTELNAIVAHFKNIMAQEAGRKKKVNSE